jgi:hypothetical protein
MKRYLLVDMKSEVLGDFDEIVEARGHAKAYVGKNAWQSELTIEDESDGFVERWQNGDGSQDVLILDTTKSLARLHSRKLLGDRQTMSDAETKPVGMAEIKPVAKAEIRQAGKGSKRRPFDTKQSGANYETIHWGKGQSQRPKH